MLSNKEIGRRIYDLRIQRDLTLDEIASKVGVAKSTIQRYEKGNITKIKLPVIESIAYVLRVNPNWLIGNVDDPSLSGALPDNIIPMPKMNTVPLIGTIACGDPILAEENIETQVSMPEHVVADFALRCKGDSMIGARIHDGDVVYIRQQPTVENGQIAAVLIGDEATLKRVYYYPDSNKLVLNPENPKYEPFIYIGEEISSVRILGLAVAFTSNVK